MKRRRRLAADSLESRRGGLWLRWLRFNLVGWVGFGVQILTIYLLHYRLNLHYLLATALGVEAALLHNFYWHRTWTWRERPWNRPLRRLAQFHLGAGGVSLIGNLGGMAWLVSGWGLPVLVPTCRNTSMFADGACEARSRSEEEAMRWHR